MDANGTLSVTGYKTRIPYAIPPDSGRKTALSRTLASLFGEQQEALLWINEFGIWPSSEDRHLFAGFRRSLGDQSPLPEKPGHIFSTDDLDTVGSLLAMVLYFCWGAIVVSGTGGVLVRIVHDEQIHIYARNAVELSSIHTRLARVLEQD